MGREVLLGPGRQRSLPHGPGCGLSFPRPPSLPLAEEPPSPAQQWCPEEKQDKLQTEPPKDLWTVAQWLTQGRGGWAFLPGRLPGPRPHTPPWFQPAAARPWPAGTLSRGADLARREGASAGAAGVTAAGRRTPGTVPELHTCAQPGQAGWPWSPSHLRAASTLVTPPAPAAHAQHTRTCALPLSRLWGVGSGPPPLRGASQA